jgi:hypothetical protein
MSRTTAIVVIGMAVLVFSGASWGTGQQPALTNVAGGPGGQQFSDLDIPNGATVLEVQVRAGDFVDSVQMVYALPDGSTQPSLQHGGPSGQLMTFRLDSDEYITGISGRYGDYLDSLSIITNKRTSPAFGGRGGNRDFKIDVPQNNQAVGFAGRSGTYLDAIGLTYLPIFMRQIEQTTSFGGGGGTVFSDREIPMGARISEVRVRFGSYIDSIQAVYTLSDGSILEGNRRGGSGGRSESFRLGSDEYIIGLSGRYGQLIDSLRIHTNRRASQLFGGSGGNRDYKIEVPAGNRGVGFSGRAGEYLDSIGLNFAPLERQMRNLWRQRQRR